MEDKKYHITEKQLETLEHYKRMFALHAETIYKLCDSEKDDVVYGFELGRLYNHLRDCFVNMMRLEDEIRSQQIINNEV